MKKYRLKERDYCWYPQVKTFWSWRSITNRGEVLPRGTTWGGPIRDAIEGIGKHVEDPSRKSTFDVLHTRLDEAGIERVEVSDS